MSYVKSTVLRRFLLLAKLLLKESLTLKETELFFLSSCVFT